MNNLFEVVEEYIEQDYMEADSFGIKRPVPRREKAGKITRIKSEFLNSILVRVAIDNQSDLHIRGFKVVEKGIINQQQLQRYLNELDRDS